MECLRGNFDFDMKLFPLTEESNIYASIISEVATLLQELVQRLVRTPKKHHVFQLSLFIFHAHAKIVTYHRFDRFIYACAAVLFAGKLTEQIEYPADILKTCRAILREKRGLEGEDSEEKQRYMMKKLFEAEVNLMISVGFDMELEVGLTYLEEWERAIKDSHFFKTTAEQLSKLYHTNTVLYFEPELLALASLGMAAKSQGLTPDICGW